MTSLTVVKHFDPFAQALSGLVSGYELNMVRVLSLERMKERFHRCIIQTVALTTHRTFADEAVPYFGSLAK